MRTHAHTCSGGTNLAGHQRPAAGRTQACTHNHTCKLRLNQTHFCRYGWFPCLYIFIPIFEFPYLYSHICRYRWFSHRQAGTQTQNKQARTCSGGKALCSTGRASMSSRQNRALRRRASLSGSACKSSPTSRARSMSDAQNTPSKRAWGNAEKVVREDSCRRYGI